MDVSGAQGFKINAKLLAEELGAPVIPTVAVKGKGLDGITKAFKEILKGEEPAAAAQAFSACESCPGYGVTGRNGQEYWERARQIVGKVLSRTSTKPSFLDRLGEAMLRPWPGVPLALVVVLISLGIVVFGGDLIREGLLMALVEQVIVPFFERLITPMNLPTVLHNILIGEYGVFRISFEWILALVIPYVILFQAVFALLEDSGICPISVLFDNIMRKLGVQGGV